MSFRAFVSLRRFSFVARLSVAFALATAAALTSAQAQVVVGTNVNMVGAPGYVDPVTGAIINDPTLNRQNEPSHAFSTRNPCTILAGANDYRLVDFEIELLGDERADAWLGVFKSFDCGRTWTSTPHPGHPLDLTPEGQASPIFGRHAAADATVRALPGGRFLYSGLAFDRGGVAKVFVSLFEDRNNKDGGDSIDWLGTTVIDSGQSGQFLDKPWIATTKDGEAFIAYTLFLGSGNNVHTQIKVAKFNKTSWSQPSKVSESIARNQGTTVAVDPGTGHVYVAWREFTDPRDSIVVVRSTDGGKSFSKSQRIEPANASGQPYRMSPFDQTASSVTFRTFSYPTMAIVPAVAEGRGASAPGRVYVAWAARGFVPLRTSQPPGQTSNQTLGDARIVYSTSTDGSNWTYPKVADGAADAGHQLMPSLASAGGKLALAYYDLRADASLTFDDFVVEYGQAALDRCVAEGAGNLLFNVVRCMIALPSTVAQRRHTLDVRAAVADGGCLFAGTCTLDTSSVLTGSRQVSRYLKAYTNTSATTKGLVQLQHNSPNLPLFKKGTVAFIGDYIDVQGLDYVPDGAGGWAWNTGATASSPAPVFMVTWADNRNVRRPGSVTKGWEQFTRINSATCDPGQAGIRNQDVYSALLKPGLSVSAPLNARRIGDLQRTFPVVIANNTAQARAYQISVAAPTGVLASFDQFAGFGVGVPVTALEISIPPRSSATRTLFVLRSDGEAKPALVPVLVTEIGGAGETDTVLLNPDLSNPDAFDSGVDSAESHVPDLAVPTLTTFTNTPDVKTPDFETPDFETPDFETPDFETPDFETLNFATPNFKTPDFETPDFETPDFETPDFETATVADVSWKVTNTGNVTSAYKPNVNIQDGKIGTRYQLVVRTVTVQSLTSALSCKPGLLPQNQRLINIVDPDVKGRLVGLTSADFNSPNPKNATFSLGKQQSAVMTLRAYCNASVAGATGPGGCVTDGPLPLDASRRPLVAASVVAQAANCQRCVGPGCTAGDAVGAATECTLNDGLPKDIYDPIPPVFGPAPAPTAQDVDNSGSEFVSFTLSVADNIAVNSVSCGAGWSVTPVSPGSYSVSGTFPVGTTQVTCTAADGSGNQGSVSFPVVVRPVPDTTAPTVTVTGAPAAPIEGNQLGGATVAFDASASDAVSGALIAACLPASGSVFPVGTTTVTCTATDGAGNTGSSSFAVTIVDTTPPVVTLAGASAVSIEAGASYSEAGATASDIVSGPRTVVISGTVNSLVPGSYLITYSATDNSGNTASVVRTVAVVDTTPPVLGTVANVIAEATSAAGATVTYTSPSATDAVGATVSCVAASGSTFAIGASTVTCTATDAASNTAKTSFTVTVRDTTAPVLGTVSNVIAEATSSLGATVTYATPTATDAVGATVSCAPASGSTFPIGTTAVTCTATDAAFNSSTATFTVTVKDTKAPVLTISVSPSTLIWSPNKVMTPVTVSGTITDLTLTSASYKVLDEYGKIQPSGTVAVAADGSYSFVVNLEAFRNGTDSNGRLYTITVTALDASGNSASIQTFVTVPHSQ